MHAPWCGTFTVRFGADFMWSVDLLHVVGWVGGDGVGISGLWSVDSMVVVLFVLCVACSLSEDI